MKNYDKTLWQNNQTVVDADYLNNIEDQVQILTLNSIKNNEKLQVIENTLPMKAAKDHNHREMEEDITSLETRFEELKEHIGFDIGKYFDDVRLEGNILHFFSNGILLKSIALPTANDEVKAICGQIVCGQVVCGQGVTSPDGRAITASYNPTIWKDGFTPVNAANLNNIENKIIELVATVESIIDNGGNVEFESEIHIGDTEPTNTEVLWIDNSDEEPELQIEESIIESISNLLREHSDKLDELFYLSDAYLDDGDFTDTEETKYIIEGGIF